MEPDQHIPRHMLKIRKDLLYRLRWPILSSISSIQISTGPVSLTFDSANNRTTSLDTSQTSLVPLFSSPLADNSLFNPPLSRVDEICMSECAERQDYYESHDVFDYKAPTPLSIHNADDSPITLGQFVAEVHAYYLTNVTAIKEVKAETYGVPNESGGRTITCGKPWLPDDVGFWFHRAFSVGLEGKVRVSVDVVVEGDAWTRRGMEGFWEMQLRLAGVNEMGRETM
ncbi:hypothetical protein HBI56_075100 [Parastagonospora nodorum]|nr:hypothetical protein HBI06_113030 [Parastagonospora nodorum]KAH4247300.1 hypothetical protein HBI05_043410 [Parastagonospora nodorum]KAH4339215.1 hypothetical protein HBH98_210390 [Parastagonospora nodorum]KAH4365911.1 hypothetical protein HBH97_167770 [Parastagonospora nodorum]KAH4392092.1 hypothetical protein HBH99_149480 [Parastagonospora nodorum]